MQAEKRRLLKEEKERLAAAGTADEPGSKERSAELDVEGQDEDWADDAHLYFEPERGNVIFARHAIRADGSRWYLQLSFLN